ncbi:MAG: hypothetical protein MZV65_36895 [Chromatiales bacterium]|nr:hypothetical protein [Chromatiales bacterium]
MSLEAVVQLQEDREAHAVHDHQEQTASRRHRGYAFIERILNRDQGGAIGPIRRHRFGKAPVELIPADPDALAESSVGVRQFGGVIALQQEGLCPVNPGDFISIPLGQRGQ